jgi:hypothetical protein
VVFMAGGGSREYQVRVNVETAGTGSTLRTSIVRFLGKKLQVPLTQLRLERWSVALLFFFSVWMVWTSLRGPYVVYFVDDVYPFQPWHFATGLLSAWSVDNLGLYSGINAFSLPFFAAYLPGSAAGLPAWLNQSSVLLLALFCSGLGFLMLTTYLLRPSSIQGKIGVTIAAAFYMGNIGVVNGLYLDAIPVGPIFQAALPYAILLLIVSYDRLRARGRIDLPAVLAFGLLGVFTLGANEPIDVSFLILFTGVSIWQLLKCAASGLQRFLLGLANLAICVAGIIAVNLSWLLPELALASKSGVYSGGSSVYLTSLSNFQYNTQLLNPLWALELKGGWLDNLTWYGAAFDQSSVVSLLLLPTVVILFLPLFRIRSALTRTAREVCLASWALLLVSVVLYSGTAGPLYSEATKALFTSPIIVQVLRNPAPAVALSLAFSEGLLLAIGIPLLLDFLLGTSHVVPTTGPLLQSLSRIEPKGGLAPVAGMPSRSGLYRRRDFADPSRRQGLGAFSLSVSCVLVLLVIGPTLAPAVGGSLFPPAPYQSKTALPSFADQLAGYINSHAGNRYTLLAPGGFQENNWTQYGGHGYDSYDILIYLIDTPVIYGDDVDYGNETNPLIASAYAELQWPSRNVGYSNLLSALRVQYVVLEGNLGQSYPTQGPAFDNVSIMTEFLKAQSNLSMVGVFGNYILFQNKEDLPAIAEIPSTVDNSTGQVTNITSIYANATLDFPNATLQSSVIVSNGRWGITMSDPVVLQAQGLAFPGWPIMFNHMPLNIWLGQYPEILIKFRTNAATAVSFGVIPGVALNRSLIESDNFNLWPWESPSGNAVPNPGYYYSPDAWITVAIDLPPAEIYADQHSSGVGLDSSILNFFTVTLAQTFNDSSEVIAGGATSANLSVTIASISLSTPFYDPTFGQNVSLSVTNASARDILGQYYQATVAKGAIESPVQPVMSGTTLVLSTNVTQQQNGLPAPGWTASINVVPLNISLNQSNFLVINFTTNRFTALSVDVVAASEITESTLLADTVSTWPWGEPAEAGTLTRGFYYSPGTNSSIAINLSASLEYAVSSGLSTDESSSELTYLILDLATTLGNDTLSSPPSVGPLENLSVSINSLQLDSGFRANGEEAYPLGNESLSVSSPQSLPFNAASEVALSGVNLTFRSLSSTGIVIRTESSAALSGIIQEVRLETFVVFYQEWDPGWSLTLSSAVGCSSTHVEVDDYANGWLIDCRTNRANVSFVIEYTPEKNVELGESLELYSLLGLAGSLSMVAIAQLIRKYRRRSS